MDRFRFALGLFALLTLSGCASLMSAATENMASNLALAMKNQDDLATVKAGAPAYLIMIDSLIEGDPENASLLLAGANLYGSYTSAFVDDEERAKRLADKSLAYARKALCLDLPELCAKLDDKLDPLKTEIGKITADDHALLYGFAGAWAGWIQVNTGDWNALAQVPKLTALFEHSLKLDEKYDLGGAHLYLGVLNSQIPPSLGGKPEVGRAHFEKAQAISQGKNLMVNVLFAEFYTRLVFEQELHDQLLKAVLDAKVDEPGLTLINTLARQRATVLLAESPDFF